MIQKPHLTEQVSWESEGPGSFIHLLKGHSLVLIEMSLEEKEKKLLCHFDSWGWWV